MGLRDKGVAWCTGVVRLAWVPVWCAIALSWAGLLDGRGWFDWWAVQSNAYLPVLLPEPVRVVLAFVLLLNAGALFLCAAAVAFILMPPLAYHGLSNLHDMLFADSTGAAVQGTIRYN